MLPDELTIKRASRGDKQAFGRIVEQCGSMVYSVCLRMMKNPADAMDASQEAFIKAYRSIGAFRGDASFSTWLYRITMNACLDMLRKRRGEQELPDDDALAAMMPSGESAERAVMRRFDTKELEAAIDALPDGYRAVIVLREVQGLSYDEIASVLGLNVNTVRSRISRGRKALRDFLRSSSEKTELLSGSAVK